jgi:hypothetical protein
VVELTLTPDVSVVLSLFTYKMVELGVTLDPTVAVESTAQWPPFPLSFFEPAAVYRFGLNCSTVAHIARVSVLFSVGATLRAFSPFFAPSNYARIAILTDLPLGAGCFVGMGESVAPFAFAYTQLLALTPALTGAADLGSRMAVDVAKVRKKDYTLIDF